MVDYRLDQAGILNMDDSSLENCIRNMMPHVCVSVELPMEHMGKVMIDNPPSGTRETYGIGSLLHRFILRGVE